MFGILSQYLFPNFFFTIFVVFAILPSFSPFFSSLVFILKQEKYFLENCPNLGNVTLIGSDEDICHSGNYIKNSF